MWSTFFDLLMDGASSIAIDNINSTLIKATDNIFASGNIKNIYGAFASIGILLLLVYFSMDIFDKLSAENFTIDVLMLDMVKIIAGFALITNGLVIAEGLVGLSNWISELVIQGITENSVNIGTSSESFGDDMWSIIGTILLTIINEVTSIATSGFNIIETTIMGIVASLAVSIIAYERAILLAIRILLSPFIFADVVGHGLTNKAMHHIKSIFAICLEGPIIILTVAFVNESMKSTSNGVVFSGIILIFGMVKLMFSANEMAKEIVGG